MGLDPAEGVAAYSLDQFPWKLYGNEKKVVGVGGDEGDEFPINPPMITFLCENDKQGGWFGAQPTVHTMCNSFSLRQYCPEENSRRFNDTFIRNLHFWKESLAYPL